MFAPFGQNGAFTDWFGFFGNSRVKVGVARQPEKATSKDKKVLGSKVVRSSVGSVWLPPTVGKQAALDSP